MDIVERIFALVDERYSEQQDFANDVGVTASVVSEWRRRKSASYVKRLEIISKKLETTPQYLLYGDESAASELSTLDKLPSDEAQLLRRYRALSPEARGKLLGYLDALSS